MTDPQRHIGPEALAEFIESGVPVGIPVPGEPEVLLSVDGGQETMELVVAWDGEAPPQVADHIHIRTGVFHRGGRNWSTLTVKGTRYFESAYPLLRSVADLVQLDRVTFGEAVERSLGDYHDLLSTESQMPPLEEIGLFGELVVFLHLVRVIGGDAALSSWRGGGGREEHDLGLSEGDVEIKATTTERRVHWIGSLTQLVPTLDRPLWLLSVQLTGAGEEGPGASRLPDLVAGAESMLEPGSRPEFRRRIQQTSYRPQQPVKSYRLLRLRTKPACFSVDAAFPRLEPEVLRESGALMDRIGGVSYQVDLDGLPTSELVPAALVGLGDKTEP